MSLYEALKTLHVLAIAIWVGAAFLQLVLSERARVGGGDRAGILADMAFAGTRLFPFASLAAMLTGIALVIEADSVDFGDLWVLLAIAGWLISSVIGAVFLDRAIKAGALERAIGLGRLDFAILVLVIADMVIKPT